jgi:predicted RND superfamily exporter protein
MIFLVLYSRYRSTALALIIMGNIPLALVGSVVALWISGQPLSVAALVGFITLTGIATRNGILKISHYINLCAFEGETFGQPMIVRGSLERLTPVLMTALVAAFALVPLLLSADAPGKEMLHPVAVVIFGGLVSSTLLDTVLTPVMFRLFGEKSLNRLLREAPVETTNAKGKLTVLSGKDKEEVALTPNGYQSLGANLKARPAKGAKAVAVIEVPGKGSGTARFMLK